MRPGIVILNQPDAVRRAVDKKSTFQTLNQANIPVVDFTDDRAVALGWLREGNTVFGREFTRSSGGAGIHLFKAENSADLKELPRFPLFTKFWKCDSELRIHVFRNKIIDFSEKRKRRMENPPENRYWIRTHNNGWIFARSEIKLDPRVAKVAVDAVHQLGLDFGAVDVRVRKNGECRILEINSAPGIEATTQDRYVETFREYLILRR
jgi:glutathione synthase/RimK-type ligase-like ATP-grasp enzyme